MEKVKVSLPSNERKNKGMLVASTLINDHYRAFDVTYDSIEMNALNSYSSVPIIG